MSALRSLRRRSGRVVAQEPFRAPVCLEGWTASAVESVFALGWAFIVDEETCEAFAVSMEAAAECLRETGFGSAIPKLQDTPRPFIRISGRTPDRVVIGTLLQARPLSAGGSC